MGNADRHTELVSFFCEERPQRQVDSLVVHSHNLLGLRACFCDSGVGKQHTMDWDTTTGEADIAFEKVGLTSWSRWRSGSSGLRFGHGSVPRTLG